MSKLSFLPYSLFLRRYFARSFDLALKKVFNSAFKKKIHNKNLMSKNNDAKNNCSEKNLVLENFAKSLNSYLLNNLKLEKLLEHEKIAESNGSVVLTLDSEFGNGKTSFLKYFQEEYQTKDQEINKFDAIIYIDTW